MRTSASNLGRGWKISLPICLPSNRLPWRYTSSFGSHQNTTVEEECLQRSKSEAGLADYEGRHWTGWHHHQTLSFIATWFVVTETRRGKKMDPCYNGAPDPRRHRVAPSPCVPMRDDATCAA